MRCWRIDWPGNVRELERVIERAVALAGSDFLELDDLPPALLGGYAEVLVPSLRGREIDAGVGQPLRAAGARAMQNNKRQACRELGISYHTLQGVSALPSGTDAPGRQRGAARRRVIRDRRAKAIRGASTCGSSPSRQTFSGFQ